AGVALASPEIARPSWPFTLRPQVMTWPAAVSATVWKQPARTEVILVPRGRLALTGRLVTPLATGRPSWPPESWPQPQIVAPLAGVAAGRREAWAVAADSGAAASAVAQSAAALAAS